MYETTVSLLLWLVAAYLAIGLILALPLHRRALPAIDHGTRSARWPFLVLVTPGIITLWPFLSYRWRQALHGLIQDDAQERPAAQESLRRWHGLVTVMLAVLCPATIALALVFRGPAHPVPRASVDIPGPELYWFRRMPSDGLAFPNLPISVSLGKDLDQNMGLLVEIEKNATLPATAFYWSRELGEPDSVPKAAVLIGVVAGAYTRWFPFPAREMSERGYLIAYSFTHHTAESVEIGKAPGREAA